MRGDPTTQTARGWRGRISTHSPRAGRSGAVRERIQAVRHFNSLAPCGAIHCCRSKSARGSKFQLTRPVRGDPRRRAIIIPENTISTHSPRAGRSRTDLAFPIREINFNSLAPCGAIPSLPSASNNSLFISTHSPRAGRSSAPCAPVILSIHFNSLAPCGAIPDGVAIQFPLHAISTHSPRAGRSSRQRRKNALQRHFNSLAPCGAILF